MEIVELGARFNNEADGCKDGRQLTGWARSQDGIAYLAANVYFEGGKSHPVLYGVFADELKVLHHFPGLFSFNFRINTFVGGDGVERVVVDGEDVDTHKHVIHVYNTNYGEELREFYPSPPEGHVVTNSVMIDDTLFCLCGATGTTFEVNLSGHGRREVTNLREGVLTDLGVTKTRPHGYCVPGGYMVWTHLALHPTTGVPLVLLQHRYADKNEVSVLMAVDGRWGRVAQGVFDRAEAFIIRGVFVEDHHLIFATGVRFPGRLASLMVDGDTIDLVTMDLDSDKRAPEPRIALDWGEGKAEYISCVFGQFSRVVVSTPDVHTLVV